MSTAPSPDEDPPTLSRLNALLAVGYRIDDATSQKVSDAIWLDHPAEKRVLERTLILYPNGLVVSNCAAEPEKPQLRFGPQQNTEFLHFVNGVPRPTLWERTADLRARTIVLFAFLAFIALLSVGINWLFELLR